MSMLTTEGDTIEFTLETEVDFTKPDTVNFPDIEPIEDVEFTVTDVDEKDIGLTTITAVGLEHDGEAYLLKTAEHTLDVELTKVEP